MPFNAYTLSLITYKMGVISRHYAIKIYFEDTETQYLNKFCTFTTKDAKWAEALNGWKHSTTKKDCGIKR